VSILARNGAYFRVIGMVLKSLFSRVLDLPALLRPMAEEWASSVAKIVAWSRA
jgi:hypothetical protein